MAPVTSASGPVVTKQSTTTRLPGSSSYTTRRSSASSSRSWITTRQATLTSRPVTIGPRATTIPERTITPSTTRTSSVSTASPKVSTITSSTRFVTSRTSTRPPSTSTRRTPTSTSTTRSTTSRITTRPASSTSTSPTRPPFSSSIRSSSSITPRRTTPTTKSRSTTSSVTTRRTTPRVSTATYVTGSSGHPIVVTNVTPFKQSGTVDGDGDGGSNNTAGIVVGILVPLILIGIVALSIYIWYRKKYPVRMGIGRNFSTFSNPAYNKRASTVTLVREDANKIFEEMTRKSPEPVPEEDEDKLDEPEGRVNEAYEGESPTYENVKPPDPDGLENGAKPPIDPDNDVDTGTLKVEIEHLEEAPKSIERPRKKAVLFSSNEHLDSDFELVTEDDLGRRRESELSVGNDSVDTRTVSLSFSEIFDGRHERKKRSSSEIVDIYKTQQAGEPSSIVMDTKPRSNSDSAGVLRFSSSARLRRASGKIASPLTIPEKIDDGEDEFLKLEEAVNKLESGELEDIPKALLNEIVEAVSDGLNISNDQDAVNDKESGENIPGNVTESNSDGESSSKDLSSDEDKASSDSSSNGKKRLSVQISKPNIVLDTDPITPYVIVQDSIIFETETTHHLHLDSSHNVIRGRRAFTMNDILSNVTSNIDKSSTSQYNEERSNSLPDIFLDDSQDTQRVDRKLDIASETYMSVSASDTDITKDDVLIKSPAFVKLTHENSFEHLPTVDVELAETDEIEKSEHQIVTLDNLEALPGGENVENKTINDNSEDDILTEPKNVETINDLNTDVITETQNITNNDYFSQNESKVEDSNYMLEKLKLEDSLEMSASFEPITESFESINSSETTSLNSDTQQSHEPVIYTQELTVQNQSPSNNTGAETNENENAMLRASTPNIDAGKLTLYEDPIIQNVDESATEPSETVKTKITTGTFKFNMNDDSESDTFSDDDRNATKSSIDSAEYTHVKKNEASEITDIETTGNVNDGAGNDRVAKQTFIGTIDDMVTSMDSASHSLSWEILVKSADEDIGGGEAIGQTKADLSWDLADDNEEDC